MKRLSVLAIRFYQKYLSAAKGHPTCRFTPTCSRYMLEAIEKRGALLGILLGLWRIIRCNPYSKGGYDPVPEKGTRAPVRRAKPITKYYYPEEYHLER